MKVCRSCQATFNDESLKFCLECGTPFPEAQFAASEPETVIRENQSFGSSGGAVKFGQNDNFSAETPPRSRGGNAAIIAAILGGFLLLALVVGGLGVYYFSREQNPRVAVTNDDSTAPNRNDAPTNAKANSETKPPAERIDDQKNANAADSNSAKSDLTGQIIASSSSVRKPEKGIFYFPSFAFDRNSATAWCEGAQGAGVGEWLQFNFTREIALRQIKIQPGYFKTAETWEKNNRLASVTVRFSDNTTRQFSFTDEMKPQTLDTGGKRTNLVKITVDDYFPGTSDADDTLISEVSFVTEP